MLCDQNGNCVRCGRESVLLRELMADVGVSLVGNCLTHFTVGRRD